jgi:hypothetical protein
LNEVLERDYSKVVLPAVEKNPNKAFEKVFAELKRCGFLLESDPTLPNVCTLITGQSLHTSWWSHPLSHTVFSVNGLLANHKDVVITKLISGKVTFVHRKLWPALLAIARSRDHWQVSRLSSSARALLNLIDEKISLQSDEISWKHKAKLGDVIRDLEKRLLIHTDEVHTERGSHAKLLETWDQWSKRTGFKPRTLSTSTAMKQLEKLFNNLQAESATRLPWMPKA